MTQIDSSSSSAAGPYRGTQQVPLVAAASAHCDAGAVSWDPELMSMVLDTWEHPLELD